MLLRLNTANSADFLLRRVRFIIRNFVIESSEGCVGLCGIFEDVIPYLPASNSIQMMNLALGVLLCIKSGE